MVRMYSTCDTAELFLNGKSLGERTPETTENLIAEWNQYHIWEERFPLPEGIKLRPAPFLWKDVPCEPGVLRMVGTKDGKEYVDERKTAGAPYQIVLEPDRQTLRAGGRDAARIVATIADKDGVMVPSANPWLSFSAQAPAHTLGTATLDAMWGMAAINVQSSTDSGKVVITATSNGLENGTCVLTSARE